MEIDLRRNNSGKTNHSVLVVEDDQQLNELVGAYVRLAGFNYRSAVDGESAVRSAQEHRPLMIILDIMLPDIDGFEVCRKLKSADETAAVPVLMLTALSQDENRQKGMECGAVDYMTKPFDPDQLMSMIRRHAEGK